MSDRDIDGKTLFRKEVFEQQGAAWLGSPLAIGRLSGMSLIAVMVAFVSAVSILLVRVEYVQKAHVTGVVLPTKRIRIYSPINGIVQESYVTEGKRVRRGDELYVIKCSLPSACQGESTDNGSKDALSRYHMHSSGEKQLADLPKIVRVAALYDGLVTDDGMRQGDAVHFAQLLGELLPDGEGLEVLLFTPARAIRLVREGQSTLIRLSTRRDVGDVRGAIASVDGAPISQSDLAAFGHSSSEPMYRVVARLSAAADNSRLVAQPGAPVAADIIVGKRPILNWLLTRIRKERHD